MADRYLRALPEINNTPPGFDLWTPQRADI